MAMSMRGGHLLSKSQTPTQFFRFIKPGCISQVEIPISFRRYLESRNSNETAILKRGSRQWSVKITDWTFSNGWDDFVTDNGVEEFDFVVFKHEGNMVFNTMVFDPSFCEREYSNNNQVPESSSKKHETDTNEPKNIRKEKDTIPDNIQLYPYFIGTLNSADCKYKLYLPISFIRSTGLGSGEMVIRNGQSQTSWTVGLKIRSKGYSRIGNGWHEFYNANGLKEGDHFKFELIKSGTKPIANFYHLSTQLYESHGTVKTPYFVATLKESGDSRTRMYIPKKFVLENGLSNGEILLKNKENEGSWTVSFRNHLEKFYYIQTGLKEFCVANGLEKGGHVKFELVKGGEKPVAVVSIYGDEVVSEQSLPDACCALKLT